MAFVFTIILIELEWKSNKDSINRDVGFEIDGNYSLLEGNEEVSSDVAKEFASSDILLLGNEPQTIGPQNAPMEVHLVLLGANVILLEGIRLSDVSEGVYFLNAAPLNLSGADGAPCRAIVIDVGR